MGKVWQRVGSLIDRTSWAAGAIASVGIFVLVLVVVYEVIVRYFLNRPTSWSAEVAGYLLIFCSLLAVTYTLWQGHHVRIELVYRRLPRRLRLIFDRITYFFLVIAIGVLVWRGWLETMSAREVGRRHWGMLRVPEWWTLILVPVFGFFLWLQLCRKFFVPGSPGEAGGHGEPGDKEEG